MLKSTTYTLLDDASLRFTHGVGVNTPLWLIIDDFYATVCARNSNKVTAFIALKINLIFRKKRFQF